MTIDEVAVSQPHFSGLNTRLVVEYLRDKMPPGTLGSVLEVAGETRSMDVLLDDASWSSYEQVRSLLEAAGVVMGGPRSLAPIGRRRQHVVRFDSRGARVDSSAGFPGRAVRGHRSRVATAA